MKKIIILLSLIAITTSISAQGIRFESGKMADALTKAKKENKLIFIDGFAVWCGPCKRMSTTVFKSAEVGKYFDEHFVAMKVDVEKGEGPDLRNRYGIQGLPGYVFLDSDGHIVHRGSGSMPEERFMLLVKEAVAFAKDPNSVGRMALRYEKEKNNEAFVKEYLDKLKETKASGYEDVFEQYLTIQKSISPQSKEMVTLLADHEKALIYGGKADQIITENIKSAEWKKYVRKDIREVFQKLPIKMANTTTDYGIKKKDVKYIDLCVRRMVEQGLAPSEEMKRAVYNKFYLKADFGEEYKKNAYDDIEKFYKSLDVPLLRTVYLRVTAENRPGVTPHGVNLSAEMQQLARNYGQFAVTDREKQEAMKWAKAAFDIMPEAHLNTDLYASMLYLWGGDKSEAIKLKEQAVVAAQKIESKDTPRIEEELKAMKAGKTFEL